MPGTIICPENGLECHGVPTCPFPEVKDCETKDPPIGVPEDDD